MASVFTEKYWTGQYTYTRVRVDYSGTSASAHLLYSRTNNYTPQTMVSGATFTFNGVSTTFNASFSGPQTDREVASVNFSISMAGGVYSGNSPSNVGQYKNYFAFSGSANIPAQEIAPSVPNVSISGSPTWNSVKLRVSIDNYGTPSNADGRWIEAGVAGQNSWVSPSLRSEVRKNTTSAEINITNSSPQTQTLTIRGNSHYWYGGYATNTRLSSSKIAGEFYTPCPPLLSLSLSSQSYTTAGSVSAILNWTRDSSNNDGGALSRTLYYRWSDTNGSSWTSWFSVSGDAASGQITVPNLLTDSTAKVEVFLRTAGGDSEKKSVTFTTKNTHTAPSFSNFTYLDNNSTTTNITNNNQLLIQGYSSPRATISQSNKATGHDNIPITNYNASLAGRTTSVAYSTSDVNINLQSPLYSGTQTLTVSAIDQLGLSKTVTKNVTIIPYSIQELNFTAQRTNNYENETTLSISGKYSLLQIGGQTQNTLTCSYRYKKHSASQWEQDWTNRPLTLNQDGTFSASDLVISFDNTYQWDIEVKIVDRINTVTKSVILPEGKAILEVKTDGSVIGEKLYNPDGIIGKSGYTSYGRSLDIGKWHFATYFFNATAGQTGTYVYTIPNSSIYPSDFRGKIIYVNGISEWETANNQIIGAYYSNSEGIKLRLSVSSAGSSMGPAFRLLLIAMY